jgi:hypothetical protein
MMIRSLRGGFKFCTRSLLHAGKKFELPAIPDIVFLEEGSKDIQLRLAEDISIRDVISRQLG